VARSRQSEALILLSKWQFLLDELGQPALE
jgi:hypothetical protein